MDIVKCLIFRAPSSDCFQNRTPKGAPGAPDNSLILMLHQFSQRRKMRLERANLIRIIAKLYETFILEVLAL